VAALTRLTAASPSLKARERQIVANYTDALAALLAEETGAAPDEIEPRLAAEAMMAFHRSLIDFARRRSLSRRSSAEFATEIRTAGEHALTLLESGLTEYGRRAAPHTSHGNPDEKRDAEGRA
jgi:MftR C-terminal domain